jgi:hypothetical protein
MEIAHPAFPKFVNFERCGGIGPWITFRARMPMSVKWSEDGPGIETFVAKSAPEFIELLRRSNDA